jgi:hypothetical protein
MLRLIRNCSHGSEVATFYFERNDEKGFIKASSSRDGIEEIRRELAGWNWYQSLRYHNMKNDICNIIKTNENYIRIKIQYIEGYKGNYTEGVRKNAQLISQAIHHYCDIWHGHNENRFPLHGDFSIDNMIVNNEGVHIIDWEHFALDATPFGFDAYNLLFEQLWFSMKGRKRPRRSELDVLLENIRVIRSALTGPCFFYDRPLHSVQRFIKGNAIFWKNQVHKFPALLFKEENVGIIDKTIKRHI